jgi:hypothetical protein
VNARAIAGVTALLIALGLSACSSQPQNSAAAIAAAKHNYIKWTDVVEADAKSERANCIQIPSAPSGFCSPSAALMAKTRSDELHWKQADTAILRAEKAP